MDRKQRFRTWMSFGLGVLLTAMVWLWVSLAGPSSDSGSAGAASGPAADQAGFVLASQTEGQISRAATGLEINGPGLVPAALVTFAPVQTPVPAPASKAPVASPVLAPASQTPAPSPVPAPESKAPAQSPDSWDRSAVYVGGDQASWQGRVYQAKWWTLGEQPGTSDVWEDLGISAGDVPSAQPVPSARPEQQAQSAQPEQSGRPEQQANPGQPEGTANVPVNPSTPQDRTLTDFKVVGYYPGWKADKLSCVDFGVVTHVCYAFAIPRADGSLRDLDNPDTARTLIRSAHENGAKVLLSVGGWSYNDTPLEGVFMEAPAHRAGVERLADSILAMCEAYGFDGVDMDWEHPRVDGTSARQYEALMVTLAERLHARGKLLTAAVLSGATADGNIYYDAAAQTGTVLDAVDFINVMAYDGGDGQRHSSYQFAVNCAAYWKETRGLPAHKVVLGMPFYSRPGWADYGTILEAVPDAYSRDHTGYNGMEVYYNGVDTIRAKTRYAREHLGGVMIWELTQDTGDQDRSLLQTVGNTVGSPDGAPGGS